MGVVVDPSDANATVKGGNSGDLEGISTVRESSSVKRPRGSVTASSHDVHGK